MKQNGIYICPTCGHRVHNDKLAAKIRRQPDREYTGHRMHFGTDLADIPFKVAEFLQPARAAGIASDVLVPAFQAGITALSLAALVAFVAIGLKLTWLVPVITAFLAFSVAWFHFLSEHRRSLWNIERIEAVEEQPLPQLHRIELIETRPGNQSAITRYLTLPAGMDAKMMIRIGQALKVPGANFSRPYLCHERKILTQTEYKTLRKLLIDHGLAETMPNNHTRLTPPGRAMFRKFGEIT